LIENNKKIKNNCLKKTSKGEIIALSSSSHPSEEIIKEVDMNTNSGMPLEMLELSYAFSHVDDAPFSMPELLSYYTSMGFIFKPFKKLNYTYIDYAENNT